MKLKMFKFIEESIDLLDKNYEEIMQLSGILEQFFIENFGQHESFLSINSRVKSSKSLREKIIRNNLYMEDASPESIFERVQDLIGLRIECRFIEDERKIYEYLVNSFQSHSTDGYYSYQGDQKIFLKLSSPQPQLQKNGFEIYKLDGYILGQRRINFELQIKSLVNVFWGEIDHRVLYKNYNYMISEDFFRDIMHSIKDSLSMIDRQLMILYDHVNKMDSSAEESNREQVKSLLSKIIHDIYVGKIRRELGFVIDFSFASEVIVEYLYFKCKEILNYSYGDNFIRLLNRINAIANKEVNIYDYIELSDSVSFRSEFAKKVGPLIYTKLNVDFGWNLFFKIISQIEHSAPSKDLENFVLFMEKSLEKDIWKKLSGSELSDREKDEVISYMKMKVADELLSNQEMDYVLELCFSEDKNGFDSTLLRFLVYDDFVQYKDNYEDGFSVEL